MNIKKYLRKKNQLIYWNFLVYLKIYNYFENIVEENINQEFRLKGVEKTKNYFLEEIQQNELISANHKKVCTTLNYI